MLSDPFAVTFPAPFTFWAPLKKVTVVAFFLPASASALNSPRQSAAAASGTSTLRPLVPLIAILRRSI